jgi:hypothetical protein
MRYHARVSVEYLAGDYPDDARESLAAEVGAQLAARHSGPIDNLTITVEGGSTVVATVDLSGAVPQVLTSPMEALSHLDASVLRALAVTGQFEEFDVSRRAVVAHSSPSGGAASR